MLLCHPHQFIFIKPIKAAGTSLECFLQPLCQEINGDISEYTAERITTSGIVGYRGPSKGASKHWNHMPAARIKALYPDWFTQYAKISIVRNPYQKAISLFLWLGPLSRLEAMQLASTNQKQLKNLFLLFLKNQQNIESLLSDSPRLLLQGEPIVDHILRFESLKVDLCNLITTLSLPLTAENLGAYKMSGRANQNHDIKDYFCTESLEFANRVFDWYFNLFGYCKHESIVDL
jgi:hypothetical protein